VIWVRRVLGVRGGGLSVCRGITCANRGIPIGFGRCLGEPVNLVTRRHDLDASFGVARISASGKGMRPFFTDCAEKPRRQAQLRSVSFLRDHCGVCELTEPTPGPKKTFKHDWMHRGSGLDAWSKIWELAVKVPVRLVDD
jgi:hypothetical protein